MAEQPLRTRRSQIKDNASTNHAPRVSKASTKLPIIRVHRNFTRDQSASTFGDHNARRSVVSRSSKKPCHRQDLASAARLPLCCADSHILKCNLDAGRWQRGDAKGNYILRIYRSVSHQMKFISTHMYYSTR